MSEFTPRRPKHIDLETQPYFVSTRTKKSAHLLVGEGARIAEEALFLQREKYGFLLLAYVLMPDHAHFVIVPAQGFTIAQTMRVVKGAMAKAIQTATGAPGAVWRSGFFDKNPRERDDLNEFIRYIHDNPVKARLSATPESYSYSSADGRCLADYRRFLEVEQ